jgi:hypothetical protein
MPYNKSDYRFTDPIRYFKENDPYYWEVDNIPLKQLQENILWLKDQLAPEDAVDSEGNPTLKLDRANFKELRPFVNQTDNIVYVSPGRFSARVNDAYNVNALQKLGLSAESILIGSVATFSGVNSQALLDNLYESLQDKYSPSLNLNGLVERVLYWDSKTVSKDTIDFIDGLPNANPTTEISDVLWPIIQSAKFYTEFSDTIFTNSQVLATEFIKMFRGVARTAIVDVPYELQIEVPPFDDTDFTVVDENGKTQVIPNAVSRIDLLFVYTKPIDSSYTTINKWSNGSPTVLTTPTLGLVRGAGVGLRNKIEGKPYGESYGSVDENQNTTMLAHIADKTNTNNGFKALGIHGSFPSPDDLMNLAPVISTRFQQNDPRLIGQSILPLAYIVVTSDATLNTAGNPIIYNKDIVDIRPFFRTAELTYNERAGVAAAIPAPSLANPVATEYSVDRAIQEFKFYADNTYSLQSTNPGILYEVIAAGTVYGGTQYGPEASLIKVFENNSPAWIYNANNSTAGIGVPSIPDWDKPAWARNSGSNSITSRIGYVRLSSDNILNDTNTMSLKTLGGVTGFANCLLFSKKITLTNVKNRYSWARAFDVDISLQNCIPLTSNPNGLADGAKEDGAWAGVWVVRNPMIDITTGNGTYEFTIFVAVTRPSDYSDRTPDVNDSPNNFRNFLVVAPTATGQGPGDTSAASNRIGSCIYPTVSWKVTAYGGGSYIGGTPGDNGTIISVA